MKLEKSVKITCEKDLSYRVDEFGRKKSGSYDNKNSTQNKLLNSGREPICNVIQSSINKNKSRNSIAACNMAENISSLPRRLPVC